VATTQLCDADARWELVVARSRAGDCPDRQPAIERRGRATPVTRVGQLHPFGTYSQPTTKTRLEASIQRQETMLLLLSAV
jgi:hypothetical protein